MIANSEVKNILKIPDRCRLLSNSLNLSGFDEREAFDPLHRLIQNMEREITQFPTDEEQRKVTRIPFLSWHF